jgi:hypothetical protein
MTKRSWYKRGVYKSEQLELTIPCKFKELVQPFIGRDLRVEAKLEGNGLIIHAEPAEYPRRNI